MCKRLFKSLKIKMDNFKLRYELAGADEEIARIRQENEKFKNKITELEKQLKNAIVPKFNIGDKVWFINHSQKLFNGVIEGFDIFKIIDNELNEFYRIEYNDVCSTSMEFEGEFVFNTKEEAEEKLKQLKQLGDK